MTRKRKTSSEQRAEASAAEQRAWLVFREKVEATNSVADALALTVHPHLPGVNAPGGRFYSNIAFFLDQGFTVPGGAGYDEHQLYRSLIRQFETPGELQASTMESIDRKLAGDC